MCGLMSDLLNWKFRKSMVTHETDCPHWDQVSLNNTNQTKPIQRSILTNSKIDGSLPYFRKLMQYKTQVGWLLPQHNTLHPKPESAGSISTGMTMIREHTDLIENRQWQKQYLIPSLIQTTVSFTTGAGTRGNLCKPWWCYKMQRAQMMDEPHTTGEWREIKSFLARYPGQIW